MSSLWNSAAGFPAPSSSHGDISWMKIRRPFHRREPAAFRTHLGLDDLGNSFPEDQIKLVGTVPIRLPAEMSPTPAPGERVPSWQCDQVASPGTEVLIALNSGLVQVFRGRVVFLSSLHILVWGQLLPGDRKPAFLQARKPPGHVYRLLSLAVS